jgi:outer membrane usher protein
MGERVACAGVLFLALTIMPRPAIGSEAAKSDSASSSSSAPAEAAKSESPATATSTAPDPAKDPLPDGALYLNADQVLLLDVQVNGHPIGKIGEFTLRRGQLMARPQELRDLGFSVPASLIPGPDGLINLNELPGFIWSLDQKNQVLHVTVNDNSLLPTLLRPDGREALEGHRVIESGTGATLNYDTVSTCSGGHVGGTGSMDFRAFSPRGTVSSGWLGYAGATSGATGKNTAVRLDSAYMFSDVNTLRRYRLGDFVTGGLSWTRPVHLGGVQINSDFSMRPDLVTFPLPSVSGSAAVPSTVDILADGNLIVSNQSASGPFEAPQLPVVSGAGTISMTVTNALGQQVNVTQPFYASSSLLAPGLQTFAVQSGVVRRNWGSLSNDYGKMAGAAIYRRGLTSKFTVEGSVEGTPGTIMAGAGGVQQIGHLGVVNFAAAASGGTAHTGAQFSVGAQRIGRVFSLGASATVGSRNFRDVASMNGDGVLRKQVSAFTSIYLKRYGSLGAAYAGSDQDASPAPVALSAVAAQYSKVVTANYSIQIHRVSIYATEFKTVAGVGGSSGTQVGLTIPLGRRNAVSVSGSSDGTVQMQVQKSAALVGDWGYDGFVSTGNSQHQFGQVQYKSPVGLFTAGMDQSGGQTTLRMESQGAVSLVDRGLFPSNTIYDSFAIVDTGVVPHVHVFQENRAVGKTDSSGRLLVPDMRSFDLNHIAIEPKDIPADVSIDNIKREMRPMDRSGVVVKFPVKVSHGALLKLVDETGSPMPLGSTATLRATTAAFAVGYDGDAYVENLGAHNELTVERLDGRHCTVAFDYRPVPGDVPTIGPLRCQEQRP